MEQKIKIAYLTKQGDTLEKIAQCFGTTKQHVLNENKHINENLHNGELIIIVPAFNYENKVSTKQEENIENRLEIYSEMQERFQGILFWTNAYIISTIEEKDDITQIENRILLIPENFTSILKPYYTSAELNKLENLIREYFIIFSRLIGALKRNSPVEYDQYNKDLYENVAELSNTIVELNPNLNAVMLENMLIDYIDNIKRVMSNRYNETYVQEIQSIDAARDTLIKISTYISEGLVKQFPDRL